MFKNISFLLNMTENPVGLLGRLSRPGKYHHTSERIEAKADIVVHR